MKWLQALIAEFRVRIGDLFCRRRRLDVLRYADSTSPPPPMQWTACHPSTIERYKATMTCPNGHLLTLRRHAIDWDGAVSPSVICPEKGCTFHAYVRLANWTFGRIT